MMRRAGNERLVEAVLPGSEIPPVKQRTGNEEMIKFSFRLNDDKGQAMELATDGSVLREGNPTFHYDGTGHRVNEIEFGVERRVASP